MFASQNLSLTPFFYDKKNPVACGDDRAWRRVMQLPSSNELPRSYLAGAPLRTGVAKRDQVHFLRKPLPKTDAFDVIR